MAKIIDLGSAAPDDPIYSSGPLVHFKPPLPASKGAGAEMKGGDAPTALLEAPRRAQFESEEEAQMPGASEWGESSRWPSVRRALPRSKRFGPEA
jgi:hypothetical protein